MKRYPSFALRRVNGGFSLVEMLAVIVLIGIVATVVVRQVQKNLDSGKFNAGRSQVSTMSGEIERYNMENGTYPQSLSELVTRPSSAKNWNGPYIKESQLRDPFGHEFAYKAPGEHGDFDLVFLGKDGKAGGEDMNRDVGNWQ